MKEYSQMFWDGVQMLEWKSYEKAEVDKAIEELLDLLEEIIDARCVDNTLESKATILFRKLKQGE